ncbi:4-oxalocrotonate tautomerase [Massilia sp. WF1]|uniref:tautomerase family protein n=1 Tax=unclassified Massilia TaxID=2609279 RepID=UPI00068F966D|nr:MULTISPECIES: tautomerase family protein [unclassified Massilia]ALK98698.1 4-oxalocrotonate tautomerase [Massilia sp. WG5]KNZ68104.1 4-oxalocrotonate tautomerase [Massilia sp. WF1]
MPHIIVKLWPGKSRRHKQQLADEITRSVTSVLGYGEESVSVGFEEVGAGDWMKQVYEPDIVAAQDRLFKKPGYGPLRGQS